MNHPALWIGLFSVRFCGNSLCGFSSITCYGWSLLFSKLGFHPLFSFFQFIELLKYCYCLFAQPVAEENCRDVNLSLSRTFSSIILRFNITHTHICVQIGSKIFLLSNEYNCFSCVFHNICH